MKKFWKNILLYCICLLTLIVFLNYIFFEVFHYSNADIYIKAFRDMPEEIEICNLGSSHGMYGFCYEEYRDDYVCFNFALESQSFLYDYRLLYYYKDHLKEGATVIIPVSYFSFYGLPEECEVDFGAKNKRYYKILPARLITEYNIETAIMEHYLPILVSYDGLFTIIGKKNADEINQYWLTYAKKTDVEENVGGRYKDHLLDGKIDNQGRRIRNEENIKALYSIIALCDDMNFHPILITTPFLKEYTQQIDQNSPEFWTEFYGEIEKIQKETGIEYYDFAFDERFREEYSLFINADHLNYNGAKKFTNILIEETLGIKNKRNSLDDKKVGRME